MYRACRSLCELQTGINVGRAKLAQQFASMDGWQFNHDNRFDQYVREKRQKESFDAFDQRVERAYRSATKLHKAEVVNAFKRKLTTSQQKFTAQTMIEVKAAVEERLRWLRDVWTQVDADYRSEDPQRQETAAKEISAALQGEPGDYMQWIYETKREERFMGPKQKAALAADLEHADLPEVTEDEVNRYTNLAVDMMEVEREVKRKYGIAGQQHWAELQAAKDDLYEKKLDRAAQIYQELLQQSDNYEESRRTALLRSNVERVHQAQVRFKSAMELEKSREQLIEAHEAMNEERKRVEKEDRIALLQTAAELKQQGATSEEVQRVMRERQIAAHAERQAEYQLKEQEYISAKKAKYLDLIEKFKADVEERKGRDLLGGRDGEESNPQTLAKPKTVTRQFNAFGFADEDRIDGPAGHHLPSVHDNASSRPLSPAAAASSSSSSPSESSRQTTPSPHAESKRSLWKDISADTYEDPFHTIHQARLDAESNYDPTYAKFFPMNTVQGKKYSRQGMGENAAGNAMENQVMQMANMNVGAYSWGVRPNTVFDLDGDGNTNYFNNGTWHVQDKETGDIDFRYEKKKGGPIFRGPRLYSRGAARDARDPGERTMDPTPHNGNMPWNLREAAARIGPQQSSVRGQDGHRQHRQEQQQHAPRRSARLSRMPSSSPSSSSDPSSLLNWRSG